MTNTAAKEETQLDRIEGLLRALLAALAHMNGRLDLILGREQREPQ